MEHPMPKLTSLHVSLPEDLKEFVRQEVAEGGYSTPSDFVRTVLREWREQKLRRGIDAALLASLETPAEEVTPEWHRQVEPREPAPAQFRAVGTSDLPSQIAPAGRVPG